MQQAAGSEQLAVRSTTNRRFSFAVSVSCRLPATLMASDVTVGGLLQSRPEAIGLELDLIAGGRGLDRRITSPHIQKTGLALTGFHEYLHPGRVLVFGQSEVRCPERIDRQIRDASEAVVHEVDVEAGDGA